MILSGDKKKSSSPDRSGWLIAVLAIVFVGLLLSGLKRPKDEPTADSAIFCGAEAIDGDYFVHNGIRFGGAKGQHTRHPHTGKYSCQLKPDHRFGLIYETTDFIKGAKYQASVWRYTESSKGFLVVEGNESSGFKLVERVATESKNGFEKVQIIFNIPENDKLDTLRIYAGVDEVSGTVYFDDLSVRLLQTQNLETAFTPDKLDLKISKEAFQQFNDQKWEAVKQGILISGDDDRVAGKMYSYKEGNEIPIKLRLKGDWTDHLQGDKWSFRIKTGGESSWNRMRTFSIQNPLTRGYLKEWMFHELLQKEDILSPKYDFIKVTLNEKDLGVYAFEEHFDKHLPESQSRREGPILKLTEDLFWLGMQRQFTLQSDGAGLYKNAENAFEGSDIRPFKENKTQTTETLNAQFQLAQKLLFQFKYDLQPAHEIFDLERIAKYFAIMDILGAYHGSFWHNLRFYYNPISSKLEPIGFDGFGTEETGLKDQIVLGYKVNTNDHGEDLTKLLFKDPEFFKAYMKYLHNFSDNSYIQSFFADIEADISVRQAMLGEEFQGYQFRTKPFIDRARNIHLLINAHGDESVLSRIQNRENGQLLLKITNTHPFPIEIIGYGRKVSEMVHELSEPVFVFSNPQRDIPQYVDMQVPDKSNHLFYRVAGVDSIYTTAIVDWPVASGMIPRQMMFRDSLKSNDVFEVSGNNILFKKGNHVSQNDITIPAGYKIYFEAGTSLDLQRNAAFISWSPVYMMGTEELPVQVFSSDDTGNGFTVLQATEPSTVTYTRFDKLNTLNKKGWLLTGAVNFFESDVNIDHASFTNNLCEDGLNIVHSNFTLSNSLIANTFSDGFDADFCKGTVNNITFRDTGNDGMDLSGSLITITGLKVYNAGDKGLSVGEQAEVHLISASIWGANTGVASKDLSLLTIDDISLEDCIKGFTAYQKKPEYGKANIVVKKYSATDVKHLFLLDKGSVLNLMGEQHTGEI
jgi:hypothetical protein